MARKETEEQKLMHKWWVLLVLAVCFVGLAYGFVSLAIDSGSLWQYAIGLIFLVWALRYFVRGGRLAFSR